MDDWTDATAESFVERATAGGTGRCGLGSGQVHPSRVNGVVRDLDFGET